MRSRCDARCRGWRGVAVLVVIGLLSLAPGEPLMAEQAAAAGASSSAIDATAVVSAIDALRADPNLGPERTIKSLRLKRAVEPPAATPEVPEWLRWLRDLVAWVDQSGRFFVMLAVVVGALALLAWLMAAAQRGAVARQHETFVAPTHVRDLDIRPEALPDDIGGVARALWDRGDQRAALALLYRGLLSRLVHVHRVPIKASSTEGDCLALARERVTADRLAYATRLVRAWQQAVYGRQAVSAADVYALCDEFGGVA